MSRQTPPARRPPRHTPGWSHCSPRSRLGPQADPTQRLHPGSRWARDLLARHPESPSSSYARSRGRSRGWRTACPARRGPHSSPGCHPDRRARSDCRWRHRRPVKCIRASGRPPHRCGWSAHSAAAVRRSSRWCPPAYVSCHPRQPLPGNWFAHTPDCDWGPPPRGRCLQDAHGRLRHECFRPAGANRRRP